ncbi:MAG: NuoM family protein [Chitinophagaceae bacterium]
MIALLLILIPLVGGIVSFFLNDRMARGWALLVTLAALAVSVAGLTVIESPEQLEFSASWMTGLGSSFSIRLDGMSQLLCLLTAISYPIILVATWKTKYTKAHNFFALMLLTAAGLMGVFLATDALLFYFFWELALIPVYFLSSQWGGEKRIQATFKFFIYTFAGSILMLVGLLYIYFHTQDRSFALESFYNVNLSTSTQMWLFWLLFIAFAIKMPVFPFHTWQPDTYEQSPTATTMVLSGIMVKMGVFAVIRWVLPVLPVASYSWGDTVMSLAVIGIVYASVIAIRQDDLKRLIAYSSIAHVGLMAATIFAETKTGMHGVLMQMFNHGINIIGLWIVVELIERQFGTRKISELGGIAQKAPALSILLVIVALANISLPLTNAFVGEFLMFNGIFTSEVTKYNVVFTAIAGLSIILSAVYTLNMIQKVFFGDTNKLTAAAADIKMNEKVALSAIVLLIIGFGIYPQPLLELTNDFVDTILKEAEVAHLMNE